MVKGRKYKKNVSTDLLDLCVGSNLEQVRIAEKLENQCRIEAVVHGKDGNEMEAKEWLRLNKKNLIG